MVTEALLSVKATERPPLGAACVRLTEQEEVPGAATEVGLQVKLLNAATGVTVKFAVLLTPPADAVTTTAVELATVLAVAVKVALVAPLGTVTDAGAVRAALLLERLTAIPPDGAASVN